MIMVACHAWDIIGARAAGYQTAFVARPGNAQLSLSDTQATYEGKNLTELTEHIVGMST